METLELILTPEQQGELTRKLLISLLDDLRSECDMSVITVINQLIAYHSVPGQWENGEYDGLV